MVFKSRRTHGTVVSDRDDSTPSAPDVINASPVSRGTRAVASEFRCTARRVPRNVTARWTRGDGQSDSKCSRVRMSWPSAITLTSSCPSRRLARLIHVHVRTLHAAAKDGRLRVTYDTRTTFRRLRSRATLADAETFLHAYFEKTVWPKERPAPLTWRQIPPDYATRSGVCDNDSA